MDFGHSLRLSVLEPPESYQGQWLMQNMSGTSVLPQPSSDSEVQLYHVLQRSNLLQYYNTFISQGGDDVQQLCEAGEEEFLEIMALVGMASKPLHVRRLQKALQEWVVNPVSFQQSIGLSFPPPMSTPLQGSIMATVHKRSGFSTNKTPGMEPMWTAHGLSPAHSLETHRQLMSAGDNGERIEGRGRRNGEEGQGGDSRPASNGNCSVHSNGADHRPGSPSSGEWTNAHMKAIAESAEKLAKTLPQFESRIQNPKKQINKEIDEVIKFVTDNPEHPDTIELTRKYAAIYGRFDSKRKGEKPMSHHEISVNEAASQLCRFRPTLLTRRDDLFPLARQVVRSSGYPYSKGHSRAQSSDSPPNKKIKTDHNTNNSAQPPRDLERLSEITREIASVTRRQDELKDRIEQAREEENLSLLHALQTELESLTSKQLLLLSEQSDTQGPHRHHLRYSGAHYSRKSNSLDDEDSFHAYTDTSSPPNGSDTSPDLAANKANETLYDAGIEIAEKYCMGDFAKEIAGMRGNQTVKQEVKPVNGTCERESGIETVDSDVTGQNTESKTVEDSDPTMMKDEVQSS